MHNKCYVSASSVEVYNVSETEFSFQIVIAIITTQKNESESAND